MSNTFLITVFESNYRRLQQRKLADYCVEIFGDMLLDKALDNWPVSGFQVHLRFSASV